MCFFIIFSKKVVVIFNKILYNNFVKINEKIFVIFLKITIDKAILLIYNKQACEKAYIIYINICLVCTTRYAMMPEVALNPSGNFGGVCPI